MSKNMENDVFFRHFVAAFVGGPVQCMPIANIEASYSDPVQCLPITNKEASNSLNHPKTSWIAWPRWASEVVQGFQANLQSCRPATGVFRTVWARSVRGVSERVCPRKWKRPSECPKGVPRSSLQWHSLGQPLLFGDTPLDKKPQILRARKTPVAGRQDRKPKEMGFVNFRGKSSGPGAWTPCLVFFPQDLQAEKSSRTLFGTSSPKVRQPHFGLAYRSYFWWKYGSSEY